MHVPTIHADTYPHRMHEVEPGETFLLQGGGLEPGDTFMVQGDFPAARGRPQSHAGGLVCMRVRVVPAVTSMEGATGLINVIDLGSGAAFVVHMNVPVRKVELVTDVGGEW